MPPDDRPEDIERVGADECVRPEATTGADANGRGFLGFIPRSIDGAVGSYGARDRKLLPVDPKFRLWCRAWMDAPIGARSVLRQRRCAAT
jgi:hypothetical protein